MKAHFFDLDTILVVDSKVWIIDRKNPFMSGFPSYIVEKHIQTLIENQYTVVLVEQFENKDWVCFTTFVP